MEVVVDRTRHEERVLVGHDHLLQSPQIILLQGRHNVRLLLGGRPRKPTCAILIANHVSGRACVRIFGLFMAAAFFLHLCASTVFLHLCALAFFLNLCASTVFLNICWPAIFLSLCGWTFFLCLLLRLLLLLFEVA